MHTPFRIQELDPVLGTSDAVAMAPVAGAAAGTLPERLRTVVGSLPPTNSSTTDLSLDALMDALVALRHDVKGQSSAYVTSFLERCACRGARLSCCR